MTSAPGYESFRGLDPAGSPPIAKSFMTSLDEVIQEREAAPGSPTFSLQYCQVYTPASLNVVAQEIAETAEASSGPVACVCCPDLYVALRGCAPDVRCTLLDFNPSLNLAQEAEEGSFVLFDYVLPQSIPANLQHSFAVVAAETPYPTEECALDILQAMQLLTRSVKSPCHYLLTGATLHSSVWAEVGLRPVKFRPRRRAPPHGGSVLLTNCHPSQRLIGWEE